MLYFCPVKKLNKTAMSISEQQAVKERYHADAMRYIDNAYEQLKKAQKEGKFYNDVKYVKSACGIAYSGLLIALDGFLILKGVHKPKSAKLRKSIEHYYKEIPKIDKKMHKTLVAAYQILHLFGYYDGTNSVAIVKEGFNHALTLIDKIKP
jgi:uncharacterized protein (UPF0332 family)